MATAIELMEIIRQAEQNRRIEESYQKEMMDKAQRQYESYKKGWEQSVEEGRQEGKLEGKLEVAVSLLDVLSDEVIADKMGLPLAKIKELRAQQTK